MILKAEELYFIWSHFSGREFEGKVRGKEITTEEFYRFIDMVKGLKYKMSVAEYDVGALVKRLEKIMIKRPTTIK